MRILTGFYVYGAICYLLIGAASIAWNDKGAFTLVILGSAFASASYLAQEPPSRITHSAVVGMVLLSWLLPIASAARLIVGG